jgi:hypothetical protein
MILIRRGTASRPGEMPRDDPWQKARAGPIQADKMGMEMETGLAQDPVTRPRIPQREVVAMRVRAEIPMGPMRRVGEAPRGVPVARIQKKNPRPVRLRRHDSKRVGRVQAVVAPDLEMMKPNAGGDRNPNLRPGEKRLLREVAGLLESGVSKRNLDERPPEIRAAVTLIFSLSSKLQPSLGSWFLVEPSRWVLEKKNRLTRKLCEVVIIDSERLRLTCV